MLSDRQRLILSLLDSLGGSIAPTDFQKLLFLYSAEWEQKQSYEFVPYKFGCFSFTCYEAQPCQCHRHCVAEALETAGIPALTPQHL